MLHNQLSSKYLVRPILHGKVCLHNTIHFLTQQTHFFANHGLHPRFDIQGVNKIVNPIAKDQIVWLANIWAQLVFNLEEVQR
jgi:hypothetical protein